MRYKEITIIPYLDHSLPRLLFPFSVSPIALLLIQSVPSCPEGRIQERELDLKSFSI